MFFKKIKNKEFDYLPRFYKPEEDETERRKRKLKLRNYSTIKKKNRTPILLLIFIAAIIYFIAKLNGM